MAKAKKPEKFPVGSAAVAQLNHLMEQTVVYVERRVECMACDAVEATKRKSAVEFARALYAAGWRFRGGGSMEGLLCPTCGKQGGPMALPDISRRIKIS